MQQKYFLSLMWPERIHLFVGKRKKKTFSEAWGDGLTAKEHAVRRVDLNLIPRTHFTAGHSYEWLESQGGGDGLIPGTCPPVTNPLTLGSLRGAVKVKNIGKGPDVNF